MKEIRKSGVQGESNVSWRLIVENLQIFDSNSIENVCSRIF
jgi:hypothetical protein